MKTNRKSVALLLAALTLLSLCACGRQTANIPDTKSENVGIFTSTGADGSAIVVDRYNNLEDSYSVDKDGNIVNADGEIFIAAENTAQYVPLTNISAVPTQSMPIDLPVAATGIAQSVALDINVTISPANASCRDIMVESDNPDMADAAISGYVINPGSDSVTVTVTVKGAGSANILIRSASSDLTATVPISATGVVAGVQDPSTLPNAIPGTTPSPDPSDDPNGTGTGTGTGAGGTNANTGDGRTGYVTGDGVNFRSGASTNSDVIDVLPWGKQITVYSIENGWARVSVDGKTGYISATYVSYNRPAATPAPTATPDPYAGGSDDDPYGGGGGGDDGNEDDPYAGVVVVPDD